MKRTVYVVVRADWYYNDEENVLGDEQLLKAFAKREMAQVYLERCHVDEQSRQNNCPDYSSIQFEIIEMQVKG